MFNYTVFDGFKIVSQGNIEEVAIATKKYLKKDRSSFRFKRKIKAKCFLSIARNNIRDC